MTNEQLASEMVARYFQWNHDRIKGWIENRHNFNPDEEMSFDEFYQDFPADAGWDKPSLEEFTEEYLSNIFESPVTSYFTREMQIRFEAMLEDFMQEIEEQETEYKEFQREYREVG